MRRVLYMAMIVAIRHNATIKAFYQHLKSKGMESKVEDTEGKKRMIFRAYASKNPGVWGGPKEH